MNPLEKFDRVKLWQTLGLFFPTIEDREKWQITFYLNTTGVLFHNWLEHKLSYQSVKRRPIATVALGNILLNHLQVERNGIFRMWAQGMWEQRIVRKKGPDEIRYHHLGALVEFKAILIAERRIELQASCLTPCVTQFFSEQLAEIGQAWPESDLAPLFSRYRTRSPLLPTRMERRSANANRDEEIFKRHMEGKTRQQLADEYNLSKERIKQIVREQRHRRAG